MVAGDIRLRHHSSAHSNNVGSLGRLLDLGISNGQVAVEIGPTLRHCLKIQYVVQHELNLIGILAFGFDQVIYHRRIFDYSTFIDVAHLLGNGTYGIHQFRVILFLGFFHLLLQSKSHIA